MSIIMILAIGYRFLLGVVLCGCVLRIYPVHLVTTLALVPIFLLASTLFNYHSPADAFSLSKLLFSISLTNGFGLENSVGWNAPSWSVSSEFFAYLCFPFLAALLFRASLSMLQCFAIMAAVFALTISLGWGLTDRQSYFAGWQFVLLRVLSEFLVGMLILGYTKLPKSRLCYQWPSWHCLSLRSWLYLTPIAVGIG